MDKALEPYNKEKTMSTHSNKNGNLGANILNYDKEIYIFKSKKLHLDVGFNNDEGGKPHTVVVISSQWIEGRRELEFVIMEEEANLSDKSHHGKKITIEEDVRRCWKGSFV